MKLKLIYSTFLLFSVKAMENIDAPKDWLSLGQPQNDSIEERPDPISYPTSVPQTVSNPLARKRGRQPGHKHDAATIEKIKAFWTAERRKKVAIRVAKEARDKRQTSEVREKIKKSRLGKSWSREVREKISQGQARRWARAREEKSKRDEKTGKQQKED